MIKKLFFLLTCCSIFSFHAAFAGESWVGKWASNKGDCAKQGGLVIDLNRETFDLSTFEAVCQLQSAQNNDGKFTFNILCDGEGGRQRATLTAKVTGDQLSFLKQSGIVFRPRVFQRCETKPQIRMAAQKSGTAASQAEIYNYSCNIDGKMYPLRVDADASILEWRGSKYKLTSADCGRVGWHAEGNGTSFEFCTATKGYAAIEKNGNVQVKCDLMR